MVTEVAAHPDSWRWLEADGVESRCGDRLRKEAGMASFGARRKCAGANTHCPFKASQKQLHLRGWNNYPCRYCKAATVARGEGVTDRAIG